MSSATPTVNPLTAGVVGTTAGSSTSTAAIRMDVVDLTYGVVNDKKEVKRLLKNVSLTLQSGNMCALMGPSGAGKR